MHITFNTDELTPEDRRVLRALLGEGAQGAAERSDAEDTAPEPAKPKRTPRKTAAAKAAEAKPDPESEPGPEPEPEPEPEDDLIGGGPTLDDVVAKATKIIRSGKKPEVKALLDEYDVTRVSELPSDKLAAFDTDLDAL